jgi:hypothetical protein
MDNFHKILSEYDRLVTQLTQPLEAARSRLIESAEFRIFLSESVAAIESEISAFKKSVKHGSQERIPQLEEAKRVAIENRSFKEAKELNDELKSIVDELAVSDEKLNSLKSKLANTRNALRDARSAETEARQRLMEIEVGFSNRRTDLLCRYREQLSEFLKNSQCQDVKDLALNTLRISEPHPQVACNNPDQQAMDDRESVTEEQTVEIETAESTLEISDNNDDDEG